MGRKEMPQAWNPISVVTTRMEKRRKIGRRFVNGLKNSLHFHLGYEQILRLRSSTTIPLTWVGPPLDLIPFSLLMIHY